MSIVAVTWCGTVRRELSGRRTEHARGSSTRVSPRLLTTSWAMNSPWEQLSTRESTTRHQEALPEPGTRSLALQLMGLTEVGGAVGWKVGTIQG
eukprot:1640828-Rhodomonas_salina.1